MSKNQKLYPFKFEAAGLDENSVVANGFLSENTIDDIIETYLGEIAGNDNFQYYKGIFPIRISFSSIEKELPLQTHPDSFTAAERYMSLGKDKLWYITKSTPETTMFLGFKEDMDATRFYNGCISNTIENALYSFNPVAGECIHIKPGCIHGVKGALEFIEISQNSDVTYHLTGEDASLEVAEAIDVIDYTKTDESTCRFQNIINNSSSDSSDSSDNNSCRQVDIIRSNSFIIKHLGSGAADAAPTAGAVQTAGAAPTAGAAQAAPQESFIAYICLNGGATIEHDGKTYEFGKNEIILIPAGMESFKFIANGNGSEFLEITLPKVSEIEEDLYMNYYEDESNYPTGSGTDPEEDEDFDDDDDCNCDDDDCHCDDDDCDCGHHHCGDDCHCEGHHHGHDHRHHEHHHGHHDHHHGHHHGYDQDHDDDQAGQHPGEFFFRR